MDAYERTAKATVIAMKAFMDTKYDWQPIETAPKDGTSILARWESVYAGQVFAVIRWGVMEDEYGYKFGEGWCYDMGGADNNQVRESIVVARYSKNGPMEWVPLRAGGRAE